MPTFTCCRGNKGTRIKKCGHLPSTAFAQKQRPAYVKEFSEKQRVRSGVASMWCPRVSVHTGTGGQREDEARKLP